MPRLEESHTNWSRPGNGCGQRKASLIISNIVLLLSSYGFAINELPFIENEDIEFNTVCYTFHSGFTWQQFCLLLKASCTSCWLSQPENQ